MCKITDHCSLLRPNYWQHCSPDDACDTWCTCLMHADLIRLMAIASFFVSGQTQSLPCEWTNGTGKLTPLISGDKVLVTATNETDCRDQCVSQTSFICAAINFKPGSSNVCELLTENNETVTKNTAQTDWRYFIRPLCAGLSNKQINYFCLISSLYGNNEKI